MPPRRLCMHFCSVFYPGYVPKNIIFVNLETWKRMIGVGVRVQVKTTAC